MTPEAYLALGRVQSIALSPDASWLAVAVARVDAASTRFVSSLWRVCLQSGAVDKLTRGVSNDHSPSFRADGALGFLSDRAVDGSDTNAPKQAQIWIMPSNGGDAFPITDEPLGVRAFAFASHADRVVWLTERMDGIALHEQRERAKQLQQHGPSARHYTQMPVRYWDHWNTQLRLHFVLADGHGKQPHDVLEEPLSWVAEQPEFALSHDGTHLAITVPWLTHERVVGQALWVVDTASSAVQRVFDDPNDVVSKPRFAHHSNLLAAVHTRRMERMAEHSAVVVMQTNPVRVVARHDTREHPITHMTFAHDDERLCFTAHHNGEIPLFSRHVRTGEVKRVTAPEVGGSHEAIVSHPRENTVYGLRSRFWHPPEVFRSHTAPNSEPVLLTSLSGFLQSHGEATADVASMRVPSHDGESVSYFVLCPRDRTGPFPTVVWIHGGPISAFSDVWHWRWNPLLLVAQGMCLVLVNPRGSLGFGWKFVQGVWNNSWGASCYQDVLAVCRAMESNAAWCDRDRMAAMGGSFGGYMTNWLGVNTDRFRALVTHAGLFSLPVCALTTDVPCELSSMLGTAHTQMVGEIERYSPHAQVAKWKTPTLITHGEKDYRVPISEALMLFEALQHAGVPSELLVFPDEGHLILKPRNIRVWYETILAFLKRTLGVASS